MAEVFVQLTSLDRAIASSEGAVHLVEQKVHLESALTANDAALVLDTAKALLECVLKTILADRVEGANLEQDMNPLYKSVREVLPLNRNEKAKELLKNITGSLVHNVSELRNKFGAASHGDDGYWDNPIELPEAEMIAQMVDGMTAFLYRKHKQIGDPELAARIFYPDYPDFNDFLDGQFDGYNLHLDERHSFSLPASKLIFLTDEKAYREMLVQYRSSEQEYEEED